MTTEIIEKSRTSKRIKIRDIVYGTFFRGSFVDFDKNTRTAESSVFLRSAHAIIYMDINEESREIARMITILVCRDDNLPVEWRCNAVGENTEVLKYQPINATIALDT